MSARQYVGCKFRAEDNRVYTYHNDGDPLAIGDLVKVADNRSDGWQRVEVVSLTTDVPKFQTKPILGKIEPEPDVAAIGEQRSADIDPQELF